MNKNTQTRQGRLSSRLLRRIGLVAVTLLVLACTMTSCMQSGMPITTVTKNYEIVATGENGLSSTQLNTLAENIAASKEGAAIREMLVAALRGYDMTAEGFDDSKIPLPGETLEGAIEAKPENAVTYALSALKKGGLETLTYYDGEGNTIMTVADVESLVNCFKTTQATTEKAGIFAQIFIWVGKGFAWLIDVPGFDSFILGTVYFAILVEILMLPLAINQQRNSRKQARLRPKEMAIRNRYKGRNDQQTQQKVNQEVQELYSKEGYSPMAGCLPMLISLIFIIPLYWVVIDPLKYLMGASNDLSSALLTFADAARAAGGLGLASGSDRGTIEVLSLIREMGLSIDGLSDFLFFSNSAECFAALEGMVDEIPSFTMFGLNLGLTPSFGEPWILLIVPVLTFAVYFTTSKLNRKLTFQPTQNNGNDPAQGCSNGMMDIMMPAMSAWFTFMVPAAVGLYWMFKSVLGLGKQFVISRVMPLPTFSEEEYKAAERELAGKDKHKPVKKSGHTPNPNVRSLHHIDDEDYETPAEREARLAARKKDYVEEEETPAAPKTPENTYSEGVSLKEDDRPARDTDKADKADKKSFFKKNKDE